jgi:hypothetical protein
LLWSLIEFIKKFANPGWIVSKSLPIFLQNCAALEQDSTDAVDMMVL